MEESRTLAHLLQKARRGSPGWRRMEDVGEGKKLGGDGGAREGIERKVQCGEEKRRRAGARLITNVVCYGSLLGLAEQAVGTMERHWRRLRHATRGSPASSSASLPSPGCLGARVPYSGYLTSRLAQHFRCRYPRDGSYI